MALIIVVLGAAALGLIGGTGVLSGTTTTGAAGLVEVRHQRFVHREADESLSIRIDGRAVTGDSVDAEFTGGWMQAVDISGISPEPAEQVATRDGLRLRLQAEPGAPVLVRISFRVNENGGLAGQVSVPGDQVSFHQFSYP